MTEFIDCKSRNDWLDRAMTGLEDEGYAVVTGVLSPQFENATMDALKRVGKLIRGEIGEERLIKAKETTVFRLIEKYDDHFYRTLEISELLATVDRFISPNAVLRFQQGEILPCEKDAYLRKENFKYHRNFPHIPNSQKVSLDVAFLLREMTAEHGAVYVVPGSHKWDRMPDDAVLDREAIPIEAPSGSMVLVDGLLIHRQGRNTSDEDWVWLTMQFTLPVVKQHFDYARAIGEEKMLTLPERTRQLLGWYSRLPSSLEEFYRPEEERLFRAGQIASITGR